MITRDPLPPDKTLRFAIRFSKSIHPELKSRWDLWLNVGGSRFENYGDASTRDHAENMARRIARRAGRKIEFVEM